MADDLKSRLKEELAQGKSISGADIASFSTPEEQVEEKKPEEVQSESTEVEVPEEAKKDIVQKIGGTTDKAADAITAGLASATEELNLEETLVETVRITPEDKSRFLDALISGERFTLPFTAYGGRVRGKFRSRLNLESVSVLDELQRQWEIGEIGSTTEYTAIFRYAMLRIQLAELNGVEYEPAATPLKATARFEPENPQEEETVKKMKVVAPAWVEEAKVAFGQMGEAMLSVVYQELVRFEMKYWTLVKNSENQDFWTPEGSTSA